MTYKKFLGTILAVLFTFFAQEAYAQGENSQSHRHCICGATNCTASDDAKHSSDAVNNADWQPWSGNSDIGTGNNVYIYLEKDVTLTDTLAVNNATVYLCLNGKTLTIDSEGKPAVRVADGNKFILCDCKGTGKITGRKGTAADDTYYGTINCRENSKFVMYGGIISGNEILQANGGGVYVHNYADFTMYGGSVSGNKAPDGSGGAVFATANSKVNIYGGAMSGNSAINGGAMFVQGAGKSKDVQAAAYIYGGKFSGNTAAGNGGVIAAEYTKLEINNAEMCNNAANNGGAVSITNTDTVCIIRGINVHDNTAANSGGGIYISGVSVQLFDEKNNNGTCIIDNNTSENEGGGISLTGNGAMLVYNCGNSVFIRNNKSDYGGGIYVKNSYVNFPGKCEISGNSAEFKGGGIYRRGGKNFTLFNIEITKNVSPLGGGVYVRKDDGNELGIGLNVKIIGNTAPDGSANNLYLPDGKMFEFRNKEGDIQIGVSISETSTIDDPIGIEYAYSRYHLNGDHSSYIIPDNDDYVVIYENGVHRLSPKFWTITLDGNNGQEPQIIKAGYDTATAEPQTVPVLDGYIFDSWYLDGAAYNFSKAVTGNMTLKARWIKQGETAVTVNTTKISLYNVSKPAILFVAGYDENRLTDIKKIELNDTFEKKDISISDTGIKTTDATKIAVFLWDNENGSLSKTMYPLCEKAAAML